jgi:hypothetical protein
MNIGRVGDICNVQGCTHTLSDLIDFFQSAQMFECERRSMGADPVRRHPAFGATRHHQADLLDLLPRVGTGRTATSERAWQNPG